MKNEKAYTVWGHALKHISVERLNEIRQELEIPAFGFATVDDFKVWETKELAFVKPLLATESLAKKNWAKISKTKRHKLLVYEKKLHEELFSKEDGYSFHSAIKELILYGEASVSTLNMSAVTGCSFSLINKNSRPTIQDGLYIRIGPSTTISDIKKFVTKDGWEMKLWQKKMYGESKVGSRLKKEDFRKNELVYILGMKPKEELNRIAKDMCDDGCNDNRSKESLVVHILKQFDIEIEPDNYRIILQRERVKRNPK